MAVQRIYYKDKYNENKVWEVAKLDGAITSVNMCVENSLGEGCARQKGLSRGWEFLILKLLG